MTAQREVVLCASIFYNKNQWNRLIRSFINPFLENNRNLYDFFYIHFSSQQGAHIRLSIVSKWYTKRLKHMLENEIAFHFETNPSKVYYEPRRSEPIFMDFKTNNCYWNLYEPHTNRLDIFDLESTLRIRMEISRQILDKLSLNKIDDQQIFTFVLHMYFAIGRGVFQSCERILPILKEVLNNISKHLELEKQISNDIRVNLIIRENEKVINTLANNLWSDFGLQKELHWLTDTITLSREVGFSSGKIPFLQITAMLFEQLDLQDHKLRVLASMVLYNSLIELKCNTLNSLQ
jgi:hypothetical protein